MKLLEVLVKVMALALDTVKLEVPVTDKAPVCVIAPLEVTVRLPPKVDAARIVSVLSVNCAAPVPEERVTAPVKALACVNVIVPVLALVSKLEAPPMVKVAVCEILPEDVTDMSPVTLTVSLKATLPKALMTRADEELLVVVN